MPRYWTEHHDPVITDSPEEAARVYAVKKARKLFGRNGGCLELTLVAHRKGDHLIREKWLFLAILGPSEAAPGMPKHGVEIDIHEFEGLGF